MSTLTFRLVERKHLADSVEHLGFVCLEKPDFTFVPGQFITVLIETPEKLHRRSYSLSNVTTENTLSFAYSFVPGGLATIYFQSLKIGDVITVRGPHGRLVLKPEFPKRLFLVATGTGVTPYRSMLPLLKEQLTKAPETEVWILAGSRTQAESLYADDFIEASKAAPHLHYCPCISREETVEPAVFSGRVTKKLSEFALSPKTDCVYLCGNPNMIDELVQMLKALEFPNAQIIREKYISST